MSDMIERVERAMATYFSGNNMPDMSGDNRNRLSTFQRRNLTLAARAAIEAMREPGIAIRKLTTFEFAEVEWPKLIDAALSQDTHSARTSQATEQTGEAETPPSASPVDQSGDA